MISEKHILKLIKIKYNNNNNGAQKIKKWVMFSF